MKRETERLLKYYVWNDKLQVMVFARTPLEAIIEALSYKGINTTKEAVKACADFITWDKFYVDQRGFRDRAEIVHAEYDTTGIMSIVEVQSGASAAITREYALPWIDVIHQAYDPFCERGDDAVE